MELPVGDSLSWFSGIFSARSAGKNLGVFLGIFSARRAGKIFRGISMDFPGESGTSTRVEAGILGGAQENADNGEETAREARRNSFSGESGKSMDFYQNPDSISPLHFPRGKTRSCVGSYLDV